MSWWRWLTSGQSNAVLALGLGLPCILAASLCIKPLATVIFNVDTVAIWEALNVGCIDWTLNARLRHLGLNLVALVVKNPHANAGDPRDVGLFLELGRSPGLGNGHLLQYSCWEDSMDRGAWWAIVLGTTKSWTQLNDWTNTHCCLETVS